MQTVVIDRVVVGGINPSPGPAPGPSAEIIFQLNNSSQSAISIGAKDITPITVVVNSTIEGVQAPFTASTPAGWVVPTVAGNTLTITPTKNLVTEERSTTILLTQAQLCGAQKTITISLTQAAAEPSVGDVVISNPAFLNYDSTHPVIVYLKNQIETVGGGTIKAIPITGGYSPTKLIDPKDIWFYGLFSEHTSMFQSNTDLTNLTILALLNVVRLVGGAFRGCTHLTVATIPEICTEISTGAFESCGTYEPEWHQPVGLTLFFISSTPPTFGVNWARYASITNIYVPVGAGDAYKAAVGEDLASLVVENPSVKSAGGLSANMEYTENQSLGYYEVTESNVDYDTIMEYITAV